MADHNVSHLFYRQITTGSCAAILSNMLIRIKKDKQG